MKTLQEKQADLMVKFLQIEALTAEFSRLKVEVINEMNQPKNVERVEEVK